MSFFIWWARRDLKGKQGACPCQSSDHKTDLPYPKNRPLIDLADENCICNNNTAPSPVLPVIVTDRTRNGTVFELTCVVDQLADLLSSLTGRGRQNVAVNIHGRGNVLMAQTLLRDLNINTLKKHNRRTQVTQIVESALRQSCHLLQLGEQLTQVFRVHRLTIRMDNDVVGYSVVSAHSQPILGTSQSMLSEFGHQLYWYIQGSDTTCCFGFFDNRLAIYHYPVTNDADFVLFPVNVTPLKAQQLSPSQAQTQFHINDQFHIGAFGGLDKLLDLALIIDHSLLPLALG